MPMLGRQYSQSRADVWASTPRDTDAFLTDWAEVQKRSPQLTPPTE